MPAPSASSSPRTRSNGFSMMLRLRRSKMTRRISEPFFATPKNSAAAGLPPMTGVLPAGSNSSVPRSKRRPARARQSLPHLAASIRSLLGQLRGRAVENAFSAVDRAEGVMNAGAIERHLADC